MIWGSGWDALLASDHEGVLRHRMEECLDGDYQRYSILPGDEQREHWVHGDPRLEKLMNTLTDAEVAQIKRGGQDPKKLYAAYRKACDSEDRPTVILVKTVKGDGMGSALQGRNTAHQKKDLSREERIACARGWGIPLDDDAVAAAPGGVGKDGGRLAQLGRVYVGRRVHAVKLHLVQPAQAESVWITAVDCTEEHPELELRGGMPLRCHARA